VPKQKSVPTSTDLTVTSVDGLKILIARQGDGAMVGVSAKDKDPVYQRVSGGNLREVLNGVPAVVAAALERWQATPRNPEYARPAPPPLVPARPQTAAAQGAAKKGKEVARPLLF
jgi:hypothetical protein